MGWRKLRIFRELEREQQIIQVFGWPSYAARDALLCLYASKIRNGTKRAAVRWLSHRITLDDLVQEVFLHILVRAEKWEPTIGAFSSFIEVWGAYAIQNHVAKYQYPMPQGRRIGFYHEAPLSVASLDVVESTATNPPPYGGLLQVAISRRVRLTPQEESFVAELAQGRTIPDICHEHGISRQRGAQVRASLERKIGKILTG